MATPEHSRDAYARPVTVESAGVRLHGDLVISPSARGIVVFAHGSGSSRKSPRNRFVAEQLNEAKLATLLFDLLTADEEVYDSVTGKLRFDIGLLAERLTGVTDWVTQQEATTRGLAMGLFGASTGAAAALITAAQRPAIVHAVVSRGGRPDLAGPALPQVKAPTLLIVGERDYEVLELNRQAAAKMTCENEIRIVAGATHLFEEPGTLEEAAHHARNWFARRLGAVNAGSHD